ncbi:PREDICTED: cdc42 effector protein 1, partial [Merops nubicus]|uniref:cdc42 effector protein 1 n=1 Tax=Merops nubicus TaxID=57421 RepID=UPI0004F07CEA
SLPQLNEAAYEGGRGSTSKFSFKSSSNRFSKTQQAYGLESGFCTIPRVPRAEKAQENTLPGEEELKHSDSLLSFRLDLGPSLMSELLQVMSFSETNGTEVAEDSPDPPCSEGTKNGVLAAAGASHREDKSTLSFWDGTGQGSLSGASSLPGLAPRANGEAHAIQGAEEDSAWALGQREAPWQGHWNDCTIEAGEFERAAQVLARHYGGTSTPRSSEKGEGPRQARTQTLWESPSSSSWRSQVTGERRSPEATWNQEEEEEEESKCYSLREGYGGARGTRSNSFEYADDEEEDDEVKV